MDIDLTAWLGLALRWFHLLAGIMWIGTSFYFIWLDNSLTPPKDKNDDANGELWSVHGGGFYHKRKYLVAPRHMPENLHWFKWEAYLTWVSGFALLGLIYYMGASAYLIDETKLAMAPWQAVSLGLAVIGTGFIFYEVLCSFYEGKSNLTFALIWFFFLTLAGYFLCHVFSDRGAFIHVGALIGTVMAANVFVTIIPNQKKVVASLLAGEKPDPALGRTAKQRSMHNNYMTLPVLLIMISNHYPMIYSHAYNWLVLAGLIAATWPMRHFFNLRHKGVTDYRYIAAGVFGFILVMVLSSLPPEGRAHAPKAAITVSDAEARVILNRHCLQCHSDTPTHPDYETAPLGAMFNKHIEIVKYARKIRDQAVNGDVMPLGNETGMTAEERQKLGIWLESLPQ
ncbi:MAG: urate hydroxylase PuuD [Micavibrio aeruginosavorus]|nr:urate hydroxylase PuuD [Micavibrio aeruginosavorus]